MNSRVVVLLYVYCLLGRSQKHRRRLDASFEHQRFQLLGQLLSVSRGKAKTLWKGRSNSGLSWVVVASRTAHSVVVLKEDRSSSALMMKPKNYKNLRCLSLAAGVQYKWRVRTPKGKRSPTSKHASVVLVTVAIVLWNVKKYGDFSGHLGKKNKGAAAAASVDQVEAEMKKRDKSLRCYGNDYWESPA